MDRRKEADDGPLRMEIVLGADLRAGDWLAGHISPGAPTRPVQPVAYAIRIEDLRIVPVRDGRQVQIADRTFGFSDIAPQDADGQCMVIRGLGDVRPSPRAEVEWAGRVREGDWLAGYVDSDCRELPVRVLDRALLITSVRQFPGPDGRPQARMASGDVSLEPRYAHACDCLVIRRRDT